jgi:hypothetical protein
MHERKTHELFMKVEARQERRGELAGGSQVHAFLLVDCSLPGP